MSLVELVDAVLDAMVVPGFSRVGPAVRARLADWHKPQVDLSGRVAVVTGSSRGIGRVVARDLVAMGATVWVTSRSQGRADAVAGELVQAGMSGTAIGHGVDMGELDEVRDFAARLRDESAAVDVLVHNAGALTEQRHETSDGIEATVATHLVGPYLLTRRLATAPCHLASHARVLFMSSGGMYTQALTLRRLEMGPGDYRGAVAYARAKRAQVVLAELLAEEFGDRVVVHAMHPGWAATAGVSAGLPVFDTVMGPLLRTPDQAADTMVWLATASEPTTSTGDFWHDRRRRRTHRLAATRRGDHRRDQLVAWLDARIAMARRQPPA